MAVGLVLSGQVNAAAHSDVMSSELADKQSGTATFAQEHVAHSRVKRMGETEEEFFDDMEGADSQHYPVSNSLFGVKL